MWKTDKETTKENEFQKRKEIIQMQKEAESEIEKIKQLQNEDKQVQKLKKLGFGVSYDPTTQMMLLINYEKYPESFTVKKVHFIPLVQFGHLIILNSSVLFNYFCQKARFQHI